LEARRHSGVRNSQTCAVRFRWRPLVAIFASIVACGFVLRVWSSSATENGRVETAGPASVDSPEKDEAPRPGSIQVTVDGRDVSPNEQQALQSFTQQLLSEAVASLVNQSADQFAEQLSLADKIETDLMLHALSSDEDSVACVYLVKPGDPAESPKAVALTIDGRTVVKFVRTFAAIDRPLAILTATTIVDGAPSITARILVHDSAHGWQELDHTTETREWEPQIEPENSARSAEPGIGAGSP
jgi:hypothetical protein